MDAKHDTDPLSGAGNLRPGLAHAGWIAAVAAIVYLIQYAGIHWSFSATNQSPPASSPTATSPALPGPSGFIPPP